MSNKSPFLLVLLKNVNGATRFPEHPRCKVEAHENLCENPYALTNSTKSGF